MYIKLDIYIAYRTAQANYNSRGWRKPKDFEDWLNKHPKENEALDLCARFFNTKWQNLDLELFMKYGFELWKGGFTYARFFNRQLIKYYIDRDKVTKRQLDLNKQSIIKSAKFIKRYCKNNQLTLLSYCNKIDGYNKLIIDHYIKNKIDKYIIVYFIYKKFISIDENDYSRIPVINQTYRNTINDIMKNLDFLKEVEKLLCQ